MGMQNLCEPASPVGQSHKIYGGEVKVRNA